jgi:hypothetical protein
MAPEARLNTLEDALAKAAGLDKVPAEVGSSVVYPQKDQEQPEPPAHLSDGPPADDFPGDRPSAPQPSEEPASPPEEPKKARSFGDWLSGIDRELAAAGNIATIGFIERREDVTEVLAKVAEKPKLLAAFKERVDFHVERLEGGR